MFVIRLWRTSNKKRDTKSLVCHNMPWLYVNDNVKQFAKFNCSVHLKIHSWSFKLRCSVSQLDQHCNPVQGQYRAKTLKFLIANNYLVCPASDEYLFCEQSFSFWPHISAILPGNKVTKTVNYLLILNIIHGIILQSHLRF